MDGKETRTGGGSFLLSMKVKLPALSHRTRQVGAPSSAGSVGQPEVSLYQYRRILICRLRPAFSCIVRRDVGMQLRRQKEKQLKSRGIKLALQALLGLIFLGLVMPEL